MGSLSSRKIALQDINEEWIVKHIPKSDGIGYSVFKRITDLFFGVVGFVVYIACFPIIAFFITIDSKGDILYCQERIGKNGKRFLLYKFRTMRQNGREHMDKWREKNPQNITMVGKVLRRLHLDELPQAINLLKGDVSFVGPRAEWSALAETFEKEIPFYRYRYLVKPGIIGWAQINFPPSKSLQEAAEKFEYDLYYIAHRSLFLDLKIIFTSYRLFFW